MKNIILLVWLVSINLFVNKLYCEITNLGMISFPALSSSPIVSSNFLQFTYKMTSFRNIYYYTKSISFEFNITPKQFYHAKNLIISFKIYYKKNNHQFNKPYILANGINWCPIFIIVNNQKILSDKSYFLPKDYCKIEEHWSIPAKKILRSGINKIQLIASEEVDVIVSNVKLDLVTFDEIKNGFGEISFIEIKSKLIDIINKKRGEEKLILLEISPELEQLAQNYTDKMVYEEFFGHTSPDGEKLEDRVKKAGIVGYQIAENLCLYPINFNQDENQIAERIFTGWLNSTTHNKNLLGNFTETGIGISSCGKYLYICMLYKT